MPESRPSWLLDPEDASQLRYWTGSQWSDYQLNRPEGWGPSQAPIADARGGVAWWQTWWFIVPGLLLCLPVGLIGLWRRPGLSTPSRWLGTAVALVVLIAALTSEEPAPSDAPVVAPEPSAVEEGSEAPEPEPSAEEPEVDVPDLAGLKRAKAVRQLRELGLTVESVRRVPSGRSTGSVLRQSLATGTTVTAGSAIALVVAAPFPRVPDVVDVGVARAKRLIRQNGFGVTTLKEVTESAADRTILRQTPSAGQRARPGSRVQLVVADFLTPPEPEPAEPPAEDCTTGYDPCLPPLSDYDCAGGSGDGPGYAYGPVYITGSDPYDLDRDGDGVACEI